MLDQFLYNSVELHTR